MIKSAQGPYYLNLYDPSYVYLISSLNLAQGIGVGHFDHPGTPVQMIGSVVVRIYFMFSNTGTDMVNDVFSRPEDYLCIMNIVFVMINSLALLFLGILTYKFSKSIYLSILIQLSPFVSMKIFYGSILVSSDNFLIAVTLLFICALIYYWFRLDGESKTSFKLILLFSLICGLGLATKLNFIPLLLIPFFLINGFKNKMFFLFFTAVSFLIFIIPVLSNINIFAQWIEKLILNSGKYGTGHATVINTANFLPNIQMIFMKDIIFTLAYFFLVFTLIVSLIKHFDYNETCNKFLSKENKLLLAILFSMTMQILIVAKHYEQYYLIPSLLLSVTAFVLCINILTPLLKNVFANIKPDLFFGILFLIIPVWSANQIYNYLLEGIIRKTESLKAENFIDENYMNQEVIAAFGSADKECALAFAVQYAGDKTAVYKNLISGKFKSKIFFDPWQNRFCDIAGNGNLKNELLKNKTIIFQVYFGSVENFIKELNKVCGLKNTEAMKVFVNGNNEFIYEINIGIPE